MTNNTETEEMAKHMTNISRVLTNRYNGDPNGLRSFIIQIQLANNITPPNKQKQLVDYIQSKLDGNALDAIPTDVTTATQVIEALRSKIKPDSNEVVLGKYMALRADVYNIDKFQDAVERLSGDLKRAYISEGLPEPIAEQKTIKDTIQMARQSARNGEIRAVVGATQYKTPKEVVTRLFAENNADGGGKQMLYFKNNKHNGNRGGGYQQGRNHGNNNYRGNRYGNNNYRGNNHEASNYNNNRGYNGGYRGDNNRYDRQNNHNNNSGRGSYQRGRGNYQGNRGRNNYGGQNNGHNNNNGGKYVRTIRENEHSPESQRGQESATNF